MKPRKQRLAASLTVLRDNLSPVVDQITAGHLTDEEAFRVAAMLELIATDLRPAVAPPSDYGDAGSR